MIFYPKLSLILIQYIFRYSVCNEGPCATWWVDYWEECSMTCGQKGTQSRNVECVHMVTDDNSNDCLNETKPETSRPCLNLPKCPIDISNGEVLATPKTCLGDLLSFEVCKRYIKLCDRNDLFREKCCKTCG